MLLGVRVVALPAFVEDLIQSGKPRGRLAFGALVQRAAREELADVRTESELGLVEAAVRDLLHAQFQPELEPACSETLIAAGLPRSIHGRAQAILAIAARVRSESERSGACAPGAEFQLARKALQAPGEDRWRWLHIVGFADATGSALDFLEELVKRARVTLYQDALAGALENCDFGMRLRERLSSAACAPLPRIEPDPEGRIEFVRGRVESAELREVARRVETCIAQGVKPERIGIVARGMEQGATRLRRTLLDLGIACSAVDVRGSLGADERAARALQDLIRVGDELRLTRWALARGKAFAKTPWQLLAACHLLGASTLAQLAELDLDARMGQLESLALPSPGLADADLAAPPSVSRAAIEGLAKAARTLREDCKALLDRRGPTAQLLPACIGFLEAHFELDPERLLQLQEGLLADELPAFEWRAQEFLHCLLREHAALCRAALAGQGGGVAILDVMEARGRTFDALFVIGLQAGRFPQRSSEDPLLPESARRALQQVLDALPLKSGIRAEDQYYFASLLRAAPMVTLCWSIGDELGIELAASPLVDTHVRERGVELPPPCDLAQSWHGREDATPAERSLARAVQVPEIEHALVFGDLWPAERARAHQLVLHELDPGFSRPARPGLYLGRVGRALAPNRAVSVSAFENTARCPWQAFLARILKIRTVQDPLAAVPDLPANVIGLVVHKVLEDLAKAGKEMRWPGEAHLLECTARAADEIIRREHLAPRGLRHWLVQMALPYLRVAGELQSASTVHVMGAEKRGELAIEGSGRKLTFIADRVEQSPEGELWTDFKTGKPLTTNLRDREEPFLKKVQSGENLQVAVYAVASSARGRYVYLNPQSPSHARELGCGADTVRVVLAGALQRIDQVWVQGGFVPKLALRGKEDEPPSCEYCDVRLACLRGDSGAKLLIQRWLSSRPEPGAPGYEQAAHALMANEAAPSTEDAE